MGKKGQKLLLVFLSGCFIIFVLVLWIGKKTANDSDLDIHYHGQQFEASFPYHCMMDGERDRVFWNISHLPSEIVFENPSPLQPSSTRDSQTCMGSFRGQVLQKGVFRFQFKRLVSVEASEDLYEQYHITVTSDGKEITSIQIEKEKR